MTGGDAFRALGLDRRSEVTDDDVRQAWRRLGAATHPDRADGGDPAAFAAAAAAYARLRTAAGRAEALADPALTELRTRIRRGRPGVLALRVLAAAVVSSVAVAVAGWQPASLAIITGALTWLVVSGQRDLAAPRS